MTDRFPTADDIYAAIASVTPGAPAEGVKALRVLGEDILKLHRRLATSVARPRPGYIGPSVDETARFILHLGPKGSPSRAAWQEGLVRAIEEAIASRQVVQLLATDMDTAKLPTLYEGTPALILDAFSGGYVEFADGVRVPVEDIATFAIKED